MEKLQAYIEKRKQIYLKLPLLARLLVKFVALIGFAIGLPLLIVLPELGIPLSIITLAILSFEYAWAARLLAWLILFIARPIVRRVLIIIGVLLVIAAVIFGVIMWNA